VVLLESLLTGSITSVELETEQLGGIVLGALLLLSGIVTFALALPVGNHHLLLFIVSRIFH